MIKILVVSPIRWDATSFYRSWGVIHNLNRQMNKTLELIPFGGNRFTWAELGGFDVVLFQRPARADDLKLAEYCKDLGLKVWVDYDDNLFRLPNESRAYFDYNLPAVKKTMQGMIMIADAVSVSTLDLKEYFDKIIPPSNKVEVIPNALNDDWIKPAKEFNADSNVIIWRGSETHWADLAYFNEPLYEAIKASEDEWHFLGYNPALLTNTDVAPKICPHKGEDVMIYNQILKQLKPRIMHVPLVDNELNRAKSNIAWIEATYAGAVCIAPNWPEWNRPGVICYDTPEDFAALLKTPSQDYAKCWRASMDYINENLLLSYVNQKRKDILYKLVPTPVFNFSTRGITTTGMLSTLAETQTE